jgi:hypothetical protein
MITLLGNTKRTCAGITRRDALTAGGLSLFGMTVRTYFVRSNLGRLYLVTARPSR